MFRKLISSLAFSPALVGQLSFYARRLRKEEATRRIGLIFTALALVVQFFAVFQPPTSANAASSNDFVPGGVTTLHQFLSDYDRNAYNLKDVFTSLGITRKEIAATKFTTFTSRASLYSWGHHPQFGAAQGEGNYKYKTHSGSTDTVYYRPVRLWESKNNNRPITYTAYQGYSKAFGGWFAIMRACGNLTTKRPPVKPVPPSPPKAQPVAKCSALHAIVSDRTLVRFTGQATASGGAKIKSYNFNVKNSSGKTIHHEAVKTSNRSVGTDSFRLDSPGKYHATLSVATSQGQKTSHNCQQSFTVAPPEMCSLNPKLTAKNPNCQPCEGTPGLWVNDKNCHADVIKTKHATNLTQDGKDAMSVVANASDKISYKITVRNMGKKTTTASLSDDLSDVLEYATLIDAGNGSFNDTTKTIQWPDVTLKPGEQQSRIIVVQLHKQIPATPKGTSNGISYDCVMTNSFGNTVSVNVNCPEVKHVESVVTELPHTGAGENMLFAGIVFSLIVYFYTRSRQMKTEVRLIRRNVNAGTI